MDGENTPGEETEVGGNISTETALTIAEEQGGSSAEIEAAAESTEPAKPRDELKVVVMIKANRAMVGIQSPNCDPILTPIEGDLAAALEQVPALVDQANERWDRSPLNPAAVLPKKEPPPAPARPMTTTPSRTPAPPTAQPKWF